MKAPHLRTVARVRAQPSAVRARAIARQAIMAKPATPTGTDDMLGLRQCASRAERNVGPDASVMIGHNALCIEAG
jgi:hypothetical protein